MSLNACQGHWVSRTRTFKISSSLKIPSYFSRIYVKFFRFFWDFSRIENTKKWQVNKLVNWSESKYADQTTDRWVTNQTTNERVNRLRSWSGRGSIERTLGSTRGLARGSWDPKRTILMRIKALFLRFFQTFF